MLKKIIILLRIVFVLCAVFVVIGLYQFDRNIEKSDELREIKNLSLSSSANTVTVRSSSNNLKESSSLSNDSLSRNMIEDILPEYRELYAINNDLVGWLRIDDTIIDYPVVRCEDSEYYLHHDFYKNEDRNGTPFVKAKADVDSPGDNFIVYAHNMKSGTMFGNLDDYENNDFAASHSVIEFDSLYKKRFYKVISVFRSEVYSEEEKNDDKFKYYEYYQAKNKDDFDYFYNNIMAISSYIGDTKASYGDRFITLSTCAYHTNNGRFVVVAKEITE